MKHHGQHHGRSEEGVDVGFWLGQRCLGEKGLGFWSGAVDAAVFMRASSVTYLLDFSGAFSLATPCNHVCGRREGRCVREKVINPASDPEWRGE
jgi:hypothetical protein